MAYVCAMFIAELPQFCASTMEETTDIQHVQVCYKARIVSRTTVMEGQELTEEAQD